MSKTLLLALATCFFFFSFKNAHVAPVWFHGEDPATGLFLNGENNQAYGLFSKAVKSEKDRPFFRVAGTISDDDDVFVVCENTKLNNPYLKGNQLTISNINKEVTAIGSFDICPEVKRVGFQVAGIASSQLDAPMQEGSEINPSDLTLDWVAGFDFNLPKNLMKIMMADFAVRPTDTSVVLYDQSLAYQAAWMEWSTKEKKREEAITELQSGAQFELSSDETPGSFTLGNLSMKWNSDLQSFVTQSEKAVLINMGKQDLHYFLDAKVEFFMPSDKNDQLRLLLTSPSGNFYFFNYMNGILQTCSSNGAYNDFLINIKEKDTEVEVVKGQPYELQFSTAYVVQVFKERLGDL